MMERIKRFIECSVPITACNLNCSYCYVIQQKRRNKKISQTRMDPILIGKALNRKRLKGTCYISLCGVGETLLHPDIIEVVKELLMQGHYINITTNGTITDKFVDLCSIEPILLKRVHIAFSFHYLELKRKNLLDEFFNNIDRIRKAGSSYVVQLNLCDEYIPYLDEIKNICIDKVGAMPQVALTRNEKTKPMTIMSQYNTEKYYELGQSFKSPLFDFTFKNFLVKRKEFCYAGAWTFKMYLGTGDLRDCYGSPRVQNIYDDVNKPIIFLAIGNNCRLPYCVNSSHFMSLGVIPEIRTPTYAELRDRNNSNWYSAEMRNFLETKLSLENKEYNSLKKVYANYVQFVMILKLKIKRIIFKLSKKINNNSKYA
jgi:organic radical activating enzyme